MHVVEFLVFVWVLLSYSVIQHCDASNSVSALEGSSNLPWSQIGGDIDGEVLGDQSGWSVSLNADGTIIAIGAPKNNENGTGSGHVRVYQWNGSTWAQRGADIDGESAGDEFGQSVSLSSDGFIVAVGAHLNDDNGDASGHVRVYEWQGSTWEQRGVDIVGEAAGDESGKAVSLSSDGTIVAIGAHFNDGYGSDSGHVRVYAWNGVAWTQRGTDIDGEAAGDRSGVSVSLSSNGSVVAIGAFLNDNNAGNDTGHVRVFIWNGSDWIQRGLDIDGEGQSDYFGFTLSLSGDGTIVAVGAYRNDGNGANSGHTRVLEWDGTVWAQIGEDIEGEAGNDQAGYSVSLSTGGNIVAIGALYNDGNGNASGHVRVYTWEGSSWVQMGSDIDGEAATDTSGSCVSISANGAVVAVGAYLNDGNGLSSGHVRVFSSGDEGITGSPTPSSVPTDAPTLLSTVIESEHNYAPNTHQEWTVSFPGVSCYSLTMDLQSWTPGPPDFVRIFGVTLVEGGESIVEQITGQRLYKWRLPNFETQEVLADYIGVEFRSNGNKQSWGFRLTVEPCVG